MTSEPLDDFEPNATAFSGEERLFNVVPVMFRTNFLKRDFDARELRLEPGDEVIVDGERGPVIAEVTGHVRREVLPVDSLRQVLRKANAQDVRNAEQNEERETEAYKFCLERIRARELEMKLIRVHAMHDASRVVFYFSADGRVDFRGLVKDLAQEFRTRIEMHQIGVRDGARMLGGIGPCGRELCCSTFLENFSPVSIKMAKNQGLTLNPNKVSGMCGRLMCCLVYEQQLYRKMRERLPKSGREVVTELGPGEVVDVDVVNRRLNVELAGGKRETFELADVILDSDTSRVVDADVADVEYIWGDDEPAPTGSDRRRRRDES